MEDVVERKIAGLNVQIYRDSCIGTGNCMKVASDVFEFDEGNVCSFRSQEATIDRERLVEACKVCPVDALGVFDGTGSQIVP